ncbi:MAG: MBL fold metallo-hydrolase, partial [Pseudomonadota bacterium]
TFAFLDTPGHALHHYCIWDDAHRAVFSGDTFGLSYRELDTEAGAFIFPTTTPTQFDPDAAHASYDRLAALDPQVFYLTHYSRVDYTPSLLDDLHRRLDAFVAIAKKNAGNADRRDAMAADLKQFLFAELRDHGYDGSADRCEAIVGPDAELNAMGMDVWLARLEKQAAR